MPLRHLGGNRYEWIIEMQPRLATPLPTIGRPWLPFRIDNVIVPAIPMPAIIRSLSMPENENEVVTRPAESPIVFKQLRDIAGQTVPDALQWVVVVETTPGLLQANIAHVWGDDSESPVFYVTDADGNFHADLYADTIVVVAPVGVKFAGLHSAIRRE